MADDQTLSPQDRAFIEKARTEGYSDEEIVGYLKSRQKAPSAPAYTPVDPNPAKAFLEGAEGGAKGFLEGVVQSPASTLRGVLKLATQSPVQSVQDAIEGVKSIPNAVRMAGANPEKWGQQVGDLTGQTMIGMVAPKAYAKIPEGTIPGAIAGYAMKGVPGAVEGAMGGGVGAKILRGVGDLIKNRGGRPAPVPTPRPTPPVIDALPVPEPIPPAAPTEGVVLGPRFNRPALPPGADRVTPLGPSTLSDNPEFIRSVQPSTPTLGPSPVRGGIGPGRTIVTPEPMPVRPQAPSRLALPAGKVPIIPEAPDPLALDTSGTVVTRAKRGLPVRDPRTGRMKRVYTSESEGTPSTPQPSTPAPKVEPTPSAKPDLKSQVSTLSQQGLGAEEIADKLRNSPSFKNLSRTERINAVREARGGPSGQLPARAKAAIDEALSKLKTSDQKRAFLMRAPNGPAFDYIKAKIGL